MRTKFVKYSRRVHRYLSCFFGGIIVIYAVSGLAMNHLKDFNPRYIISQKEYKAEGEFPCQPDSYSKEDVIRLLEFVGEENAYTKHYYPNRETMKVFLRDGSSLTVNLNSGQATYESIKKRPVISQFATLHYNPGKWWTLFSDIFAISLLIITITGFIIVKGKKGFWGISGILFLSGIIIPILFLIFI